MYLDSAIYLTIWAFAYMSISVGKDTNSRIYRHTNSEVYRYIETRIHRNTNMLIGRYAGRKESVKKFLKFAPNGVE